MDENTHSDESMNIIGMFYGFVDTSRFDCMYTMGMELGLDRETGDPVAARFGMRSMSDIDTQRMSRPISVEQATRYAYQHGNYRNN